MISVKKALAVLLIASFIVISLQPAFHTSRQATALGFSIPVQPGNYNSGKQVTVYIPQGSPGKGILSNFLSSYGVSLTNYGLLNTFHMPAEYATLITDGLNSLQNSLGMNYYISNNSAVAYPALTYAPSLQTPSAYVPSNIATAYSFNSAYNQNITGKGSTIALVDAYGDPSIKYDVRAFDNMTGLPPINLSIVYPNHIVPSGYNQSWSIETATDVEWAHAMAPGANIVLVIARDANVSTLDTAVSYVVSNNIANIISLSWGIQENQLGRSGVLTFSSVYKDAAQNGITILAATGDFGAYDQQNALTVNFPSSDPYVLAIGGTSLFVTNNVYRETAWGGILDGSSYGSGGGFSTDFKTPWWQQTPGYNSYGSAYRGSPDVSMDANKDTGMFVIAEAKDYKIGGTSIGTPIWADVVSLMNQATGKSLGFINPLLYQMSNTPAYAKSFYDVTQGNNGYYNATPGWDAATGLGTPIVGALINSTENIMNSYGSQAMIYGGGYNSSEIQATLSLSGSSASETMNGSTFYYLSSYYNQNNSVKIGLKVNNTTISGGYMISQNGVTYQSFTPLSSFTTGIHSYNLDLNVTGSYVNYSIGGPEKSVHLFLENSGRSSMSFGTEQLGSMTNDTQIPGATFHNVTLIRNGTSSQPKAVYENHYSSSGFKGYSTIQITKSTGSNYSVGYSPAPSDKSLTSYTNNNPQIVYTLSYSATPTAQFAIANGTGAWTWYLNGTKISGSNNYNTFNAGGVYNVTANSTTTPGLSLTRFIYIPFMETILVNASSKVSYDLHPQFTAVVNQFYSYSGTISLKVPSIQGSNNLTVSSKGFISQNSPFSGGVSQNLTILPLDVSLSVFAYPGNATVTINGNSIPGALGIHTDILQPQTANITVSSLGYKNATGQINLMPGTNYTTQSSLQPLSQSGFAAINGNVTDGFYSFPISGVNVSINGSGYLYTNQSGYFIMYLKPGNYNISFTSPLYRQKYLNLSINSALVESLSISLYPKSINTTPPSISLGRMFPLLFYLGYVSWSAYKGPNFAAYQIYVSTNHTMSNYRTVTINNQNTTFAFLTGILPGQTYYIKVTLYLNDGEIYSSGVLGLSYSSPLIILANFAIVFGIVAYAVMAIRYIGRMRKKRTIRL